MFFERCAIAMYKRAKHFFTMQQQYLSIIKITQPYTLSLKSEVS